MAHVPTEHAVSFGADLLLGMQANRDRNTHKVKTGKENTWGLWESFCADLGHDPYLTDYQHDPLDFFIVFGLRYRRGDIGKDNKGRPVTGCKPVRGSAVETALQAVGERFSELGGADPRLPNRKDLSPRLKGLYKFFRNEDPPSSRIWPVCLRILQALQLQLQGHPDQAFAGALLDMTIIAFYFLCRPGEYAISSNTDTGRSTPFRLADVQFASSGHCNIPATTGSLNDVNRADYVSLTFTDQKNAVRGEAIGHHCNGEPTFSPVKAVRRRVLHLRMHNAPPTTPLHTYYPLDRVKGPQPRSISTKDITYHLRLAADAVKHITGIPPDRIQAYSLRSGGATALLCANVDKETIQLIGRWKSDAMFRYLRTQAKELSRNHSKQMFAHGHYTFGPTSAATSTTAYTHDLLPREAPPAVVAACGPLLIPAQS